MRVVTDLAAKAALGSAEAAERLRKIVRGEEAEPPVTGLRVRDEYDGEGFGRTNKPLPLKVRRRLLEQRRKANR